MKILNIVIVLILVSFTAYAESFVERSAVNGKVHFLAPKEFTLMSKKMLEMKYPSRFGSKEVLSDVTQGVTLAFNHTKGNTKQGKFKEAHVAFFKTYHNLHPSAKWIRDEVFTKDGKDFLVFELITPAIDTQIHNIIYITSLNNRLLYIAFNTTVEQSKVWLPIGKKIMESI